MRWSSGHYRRAGFTLIELLLAGVMTAFVLGAVSLSLSQLSRAKSGGRQLLAAHLRADAALTAVRRDVITLLRDRDLFWTRLLLTDHSVSTPYGRMDRDEIIVFNTNLRPIRDLDFIGDGIEFETQIRIDEDSLGPVLWRRRDAVPDEYPRGGGIASPLVNGVVSLAMEAYDGDLWYQDWDSDFDGLPLAIRVTVVASGCRDGANPFDSPLAILRTVVPIDRVPPPDEPPADEDEPSDDTDQGDEDAPDAGDVSNTLPPNLGQPGQPGRGGIGGRGGRGGRGGSVVPGVAPNSAGSTRSRGT